MISKKHSIIFKYLSEKNEYITAVELSQLINVSIRTIKRYIQDLNYFLLGFGVEVASTKGIGYKLKGSTKEIRRIKDEAVKFIEGFEMDDSLDGRIKRVLCIFLNSEYVKVDELSVKLNLSIPSINKLIVKVKSILKEYELSIVSKPFHGSKIVGEEIKIRSLILNYAVSTDENNFIEVMLENISKKEIITIEKIIIEGLKDNDIIVSDKDFNLLLTRIITSLSRVRGNYTIEEKSFEDSYIVHSYNFISEILQKIGTALYISINESEILYVSSSSGVIIYNYNTRKELIIDSHGEVNKFVEDTLMEISLITNINFREDNDFISALVMHLKIFINRFKAGVSSKNPMLEQIKAKLPMETNLATILAKKLKEQFNVILDEDEIGFIAMHFGAAFERKKGTSGKKVCIICHYGIGTSQLLAEKLKQRISDIIIVGTYPVRYLDIALNQDIDFIVSTVKLDKMNFKVPVLYIENVFSDEIVNELHKVFHEKEQKRKIFKEVFNKEAFFKLNAQTSHEAIKRIGLEMKNKGFIDDEVITMVLEREKMSSTDIGHLVAIPHTILEGTYKSIIGVGILEKPIMWNKEEVQLIFMVCFNKSESYNFPVFKYLYNFIEDEDEVRRVLKFFDFDKLMEILDVK